jgi:hypothetical protein
MEEFIQSYIKKFDKKPEDMGELFICYGCSMIAVGAAIKKKTKPK